MNKKVIIAVAVIFLVLIGGAAFVMSSRNRSSTALNTTGVSPTDSVETSQGNPMSLKDLLTSGVSQQCTFSDITEEMSVQGTTYIAGGKMRGDFNTTVEGTPTSGHTIFDGQTNYVWMDGTLNGFKMDIDPTDTTTSDSSNQQGLDMEKSLDYNCSIWIPDQSLFTPPTDITFTAFAVPTISGETGTQVNTCSVCDPLTGDEKLQCLSALNCN